MSVERTKLGDEVVIEHPARRDGETFKVLHARDWPEHTTLRATYSLRREEGTEVWRLVVNQQGAWELQDGDGDEVAHGERTNRSNCTVRVHDPEGDAQW